MFEQMGYKHTGLGVLTLEGPIDPDKVSSVSRDAIVAFVECQVIIFIMTLQSLIIAQYIGTKAVSMYSHSFFFSIIFIFITHSFEYHILCRYVIVVVDVIVL